ncbi:type II toxin-antitoxin system RelE/ParE family toxin [Labrys okinawensis]|uniref:type II toxin-antitoxin system RelE/ParE family toxin n=1 Tax=Labrys okinawensis TaxID=346911 RepID=UPI0039BD0374
MTTRYEIFFRLNARSDLLSIYKHIAKAVAPKTAGSFVLGIEEFCRGLTQFPQRGIVRPGMRPGTRLAFYRRQVTISYFIDEENKRIVILEILGKGRDFEAALGIKNKNG